MTNLQVGFIGLGVMGRSMAGHLLAAGHRLVVYTRTRASAAGLLAAGARWAETPAEVAQQSTVVFSMVGFPQDVEEVYFGPSGILAGLRAGDICVDMTTSDPELAVRIAGRARELGAQALDAPVTGGDKGAREATLSIMVGGDPAAFERVRPLFEVMGKCVVHHGPAGNGQRCKLCNQIAIAANMVGVCETLAYARRSGLDSALVLKSVSSGSAGSWQMSNMAPRMLAGDFAPGFYVKHLVKDLTLASGAAAAMDLDLPGLALALERYRRLAASGSADEGTQALYKLYATDQTSPHARKE
jgi:3-hydroxyisobutyrate dehydrogenase